MRRRLAEGSIQKSKFSWGTSWLPALFPLLCSFFINGYNIDFPVGFHADEVKKFGFVENNQTDFLHPILLLQAGRLSHSIFGEATGWDISLSCRLVSALAGSVIVLAVFFIAKRLFRKQAWLVATSVAVSPLVAVHAHYFKEDALFTACLFLSLIAFIRFLRNQSVGNQVLWALCTGCALACQYKGLLLFLLYALFCRTALESEKRPSKASFLRFLFGSCLVAFLLNYPILWQSRRFVNSVLKELRHSAQGHTLKIDAWSQGFTFHLRHSLWDGLTPAIVVFAIAGILMTLRFWSQMSLERKLLTLQVLVFYFAHELSPLKPFPGYARYMMPATPGLVILAWCFFSDLNLRVRMGRLGRSMMWCLGLVLLLLIPGQRCARYLSHFDESDTRLHLQNWRVNRKNGPDDYVFSRYTSTRPSDKALFRKHLKDPGQVRYLVVSSFYYDRYHLGRHLEGQDEKVHQAAEHLERLFETYHYLEFRPEYPSFAFSNPTIRVVDTHSPRRSSEPRPVNAP